MRRRRARGRRGTFQIDEECDATHHDVFRTIERQIGQEPAGGRDHLHEAEMKAARRTEGHPDHTVE